MRAPGEQTGRDEATRAQITASHPGRTTWVSANAGSGKTRVLTERVARLLLAGSAPQRILCLTYTRAAAAEMQGRLFALLGGWSMADDAALSGQLAAISEESDPTPDLALARRLFAQALETPGGLKIQTIHSFCASLLRRFPLEAGVSPGFEEMDERRAQMLQSEVCDMLATEAPDNQGLAGALETLADQMNEEGLGNLAARIVSNRDKFPVTDDEALAALLGASPADSPASVMNDWAAAEPWEETARLAALMCDSGVNDQRVGEPLASASVARADPLRSFTLAAAAALTGKDEPRKLAKLPAKAVREISPGADLELQAFQDRFLAARARLLSIHAFRATQALHRFAEAFLARYDEAKAQRGLLDYDDLIGRTRALLTRSEMSAWALYKLDGGLDHILVDEAQDTSPAQWAVIDALASEFFAGEGAARTRRTLFVVGDEKQSIYSFQGAAPREFGRMKAHTAAQLIALDSTLSDPPLVTSFRSAPAILDFVDAVIAAAPGGLSSEEVIPRHRAHHRDAPGQVDLWPLVEKREEPEQPPWFQPLDAPSPDAPKVLLARQVADQVAEWLDDNEPLPARGRPMRPSDILILVRGRDLLAQEMIRGLKNRGVAVAGADRLKLAAELSVKDLLAAAKAALTPADDLSLAALLRSPLGDASEDDLFELAYNRRGSLRRALSDRPEIAPHTAAMMADLADRADFLRPYEFLSRILIHHDGRRRLIARLGREAEDPIDELLSEAIEFETREAPSLTRFIDWIERGEKTIKREHDSASGEVRIMTVHGAKGLEAPVVILPDTMRKPGRHPPVTLSAGDPPVALLAGKKGEDPPERAAARAAHEEGEAEEARRLLYVAMTRAEDRLVICGAGDAGKTDGAWYGLAEQAMNDLAPVEEPDPASVRSYRTTGIDGVRGEGAAPVAEALAADAPEWLTRAPVAEARAAGQIISPSNLGGSEIVPGGPANTDREAARRRGDLIHRLLDLVDDPDAATPDIFTRLLSRWAPDLDPASLAGMAAEAAAAVSAAPPALWSAASLAEAAIAANPGKLAGARLFGRIDRLILGPDALTVVEIKTNRRWPDDPAETPTAYLRQLAAYREAAAQLYPGRIINAAILWTAAPAYVALPAALLDRELEALSADRAVLDRDEAAS